MFGPHQIQLSPSSSSSSAYAVTLENELHVAKHPTRLDYDLCQPQQYILEDRRQSTWSQAASRRCRHEAVHRVTNRPLPAFRLPTFLSKRLLWLAISLNSCQHFTMSSYSIMSEAPTLLNLCPEIRNAIYNHLFAEPYSIHLRTPSQRRLRCSRTAKNDPRGILSTCQQLRREALPIFFNINMLIFRHTVDALEFLNDQGIHQSIRNVISKIAIDDGDISFANSNLWEAQARVLEQLPFLQNLQTIEFRIYARHDSLELMRKLKAVRCCWHELSLLSRGITPPNSNHSSGASKDICPHLLNAFEHANLQVDTISSKCRYDVGDKNAFVYLECMSLIAGKPGELATLLGKAEQAAAQRLQRVGTRALRDENTLRSIDDQ